MCFHAGRGLPLIARPAFIDNRGTAHRFLVVEATRSRSRWRRGRSARRGEVGARRTVPHLEHGQTEDRQHARPGPLPSAPARNWLMRPRRARRTKGRADTQEASNGSKFFWRP
jgi:hypothetical protein